jgi:hypothetical protein
MTPYAIAYSIGYFYGRAYPSYIADDITMPVQDHYHRNTEGFKAGFEAGQRDFQDVDLPTIALAYEEVDAL